MTTEVDNEVNKVVDDVEEFSLMNGGKKRKSRKHSRKSHKSRKSRK